MDREIRLLRLKRAGIFRAGFVIEQSVIGLLVDPVQSLRGVACHVQQAQVGWHQEFFSRSVVEKSQQGIIVAIRIDQNAGLHMNFQLRPGQDLEEFVKRSVATRQRDEGIHRDAMSALRSCMLPTICSLLRPR